MDLAISDNKHPSLTQNSSELFERRLPLVIASFGFAVFTISVAVAKDVQTIMICMSLLRGPRCFGRNIGYTVLYTERLCSLVLFVYF